MFRTITVFMEKIRFLTHQLHRNWSWTLVITHHSCPDDRLIQFSLANVHKGGIRHHRFHFTQRERLFHYEWPSALSIVYWQWKCDVISLEMSTDGSKSLRAVSTFPSIDTHLTFASVNIGNELSHVTFPRWETRSWLDAFFMCSVYHLSVSDAAGRK